MEDCEARAVEIHAEHRAEARLAPVHGHAVQPAVVRLRTELGHRSVGVRERVELRQLPGRRQPHKLARVALHGAVEIAVSSGVNARGGAAPGLRERPQHGDGPVEVHAKEGPRVFRSPARARPVDHAVHDDEAVGSAGVRRSARKRVG